MYTNTSINQATNHSVVSDKDPDVLFLGEFWTFSVSCCVDNDAFSDPVDLPKGFWSISASIGLPAFFVLYSWLTKSNALPLGAYLQSVGADL